MSRALATLLVMTALAGVLHDPPAGPGLAGYNLVVITIDTLRADHMGAYGYGRDTSPFLDSLARQGVQFDCARSTSSYTRESVAALFTGQLPSQSGAVGWNAAPPPAAVTLAEVLAATGYATGFFTNTTMLENPAFTTGFDEVRHLAKAWGESRTGTVVTDAALDFARRHAGAPFFLYVHYLDPHAPYDPPPELQARFAATPFAHPLDLYRDVRPHLAELRQTGFGPGDPRFEDLVLRYDAEILASDRAVERLFAGLGALPSLDRTLVVVTADHGEEFLEHGFVDHAWTLYEESVRIPLIVWAPRALRPARVPEPVSTVDLFPTLLALLDVAPPAQPSDGGLLFRRTGRGPVAAPPATTYVGELLIAERNVVRAAIEDGQAYMAAQRWLTPDERPLAAKAEEALRAAEARPPFDLDGPIVHEELYDLARDPGETRSDLDAAPARAEPLRAALRRYRERRGGTTLRAPALAPGDLERLRALGYLDDEP